MYAKRQLNPIPMKHATLALSIDEIRAVLRCLLDACTEADVQVYIEDCGERSLSARFADSLLSSNLPKTCVVGTTTLFVETDGACYPCNSSSRRFPGLCLGNAFDGGILGVWRSERAKMIRQELSQGVPPGCASACDYCNILRNLCHLGQP